MSKKLSIIIPAYNASQYLRRCVESCVLLLDAEIIIVNDGSTDSTFEIANELSLKYYNVKVINQNNSGVSVARNSGISCAEGEWLFFVDADDWINADELNKLLKEVGCYGECVVNFGCSFDYSNRCERHHVHNQDITPAQLLNSGYFQLATWNYIFPAIIVKKNHIVFPEGIICNEDQAFNIKTILSCDKILIRDYNVYNYNQTNILSASHAKHDAKWRESKLQATTDIINYCIVHQVPTSIIKNQIKRMFESYINDRYSSMTFFNTYRIYKKYYDFTNSYIDSWDNITPLKIYRKYYVIGVILFMLHKLLNK